ncbi:MAG: FtsX-like permease family protein [Planctomycetes bacterium]|nr:FtsX-like permease family protein [Planctomycetota bacterium]
MFIRLVRESLLVRWRRKLAAVAAVALGTGAAAGLLALFMGVGDLVSAELRRYGANILVTGPGGTTLPESELPGIKDHFWKHQIAGFAPFLPVETTVNGKTATVVGTRVADLRTVVSGWKIDGDWMRAPGDAMIGASLARDWNARPGDRLRVGDRELLVRGVVSTGGDEERQVLVDLAVAQAIAGKPGRVKHILVSAVVTPEAELARMLHKDDGTVAAVIRQMRIDPTKVRPEVVERFACTPYPTTIALSIEQKIPGARARPIRQATETEGAVLERVRGAFLLLTILAAVAGGLGVLAAMTASVVERRKEIGLLKALGATDGRVAALILVEAAVIGVIGGLLGLVIGFTAARAIGAHVFATPPPIPPALALLTLLVAVAISLTGVAWPLREAVRMEPKRILHEA